MNYILLVLIVTSSIFAFECTNEDMFEIINTEFEEKIMENDPRLCFNKEKLKNGINLPYRKRLMSTFSKLDQIYKLDLTVRSKSGSPISALGKLDPKLANTEILGLTRMDTQGNKPGDSNRSWDYYDLEPNNKSIRVISPIHEFIGSSKDINKDEFTRHVISEMDRYKQRFNCRYGTQIAISTRLKRIYKKDLEIMNIKSSYKDSREFKESLLKNKDKIDNLFSSLNPKEDRIDRNYNCPDEYDTTDNSVSYKAEDSCNIQLRHEFKSNSAEITKSALMNSPGYERFMQCFNKKKLRQKLLKVYVSSSSNSLRNTTTEYGKYDWKKLSDDRAVNTSKAFFEILNPESEKSEYKKWSQDFLTVNSNGKNGDGTSGPCALEWRNGKVVQKKKYLSSSGRKKLEQFKNVTLTAKFSQNVKNLKKSPTFYFQKRCKAIHYKCREYTENDSNQKKRRKSIRQPEVFRTRF